MGESKDFEAGLAGKGEMGEGGGWWMVEGVSIGMSYALPSTRGVSTRNVACICNIVFTFNEKSSATNVQSIQRTRTRTRLSEAKKKKENAAFSEKEISTP